MTNSLDSLIFKDLINQSYAYYTLTLPNPNVGAAVVQNGEIISTGFHTSAGTPHAEVHAIFSAFCLLNNLDEALVFAGIKDQKNAKYNFLLQNAKDVFKDCVLYVTLEPCACEGRTPSCAHLLSILGFKSVKIALADPTINGGGSKLFASTFSANPYIISAAKALIFPFTSLYNTGRFNLYKIATRLDGNPYGEGKISSPASLYFLHLQRSIARSIAISGATLRRDDPRLSTYLLPLEQHKDAIIFSSTTKYSDLHSFRLSSQPREITIASSLSSLGEALSSGFNIFEGTFSLLPTVIDFIDLVQLEIAPSLQDGRAYPSSFSSGDLSLSFMHSHFLPNSPDLFIWLRK